jgi:hypothetical protein
MCTSSNTLQGEEGILKKLIIPEYFVPVISDQYSKIFCPIHIKLGMLITFAHYSDHSKGYLKHFSIWAFLEILAWITQMMLGKHKSGLFRCFGLHHPNDAVKPQIWNFFKILGHLEISVTVGTSYMAIQLLSEVKSKVG